MLSSGKKYKTKNCSIQKKIPKKVHLPLVVFWVSNLYVMRSVFNLLQVLPHSVITDKIR